MILVSASVLAHAQFSAGIRVGYNSVVQQRTLPNLDLTFGGNGFHAGLYGSIVLKDKWSIQPEVMYNALGFNSDRMDFISVPVLMRYAVHEKVAVLAGPQVGILVSNRQPDSIPTDLYRDGDFGVNAGLSASLGRFSLDARYYYGITDVLFATAYPDGDIDGEARYRVWQFSLGYRLFGED